ncbi:hypothetical protein, partial [Pseudonocardia acaciae]|uniref:preprotein translocase subunit SecA n=1 Tax=Pseudonocardia acaciae TaxID=551276 RepID=UPI000566BE6B
STKTDSTKTDSTKPLTDAEAKGLAGKAKQLYEDVLKGKTFAELKTIWQELKSGARTLHEDGRVEALAVAYAAIKAASPLRARIFLRDSQLAAALVMADGHVAGMPPSSGKTWSIIAAQFISLLRQYRAAGEGESIRGVDVFTTIQDLANAGGAKAGKVWTPLGEKVFVNSDKLSAAEKKAGYDEAQIRYHRYSSYGFDTKNGLAPEKDGTFLIDEFDLIAVRWAHQPLVIAKELGGALPFLKDLQWARKIAPQLLTRTTAGGEVHVEVGQRRSTVTPEGKTFVEKTTGIDLSEEPGRLKALEAVLTAEYSLKRGGKDGYQIGRGRKKNREVWALDATDTIDGRHYDPLLENAIRLKENLPLGKNREVVARTSMYEILSRAELVGGTTGTTDPTGTRELYPGIGSTDILTEKPSRLVRLIEDRSVNSGERREKVADRIQAVHKTGRPALAHVFSARAAEKLAKVLRARGLKVDVVHSGTPDAQAEAIIGEALRPGRITVVSPRAGRGTDFMLGGNPDVIAAREIARRGLDPNSLEADQIRDGARRLAKRDRKLLNKQGGAYQARLGKRDHRNDDIQEENRVARDGDKGETQLFLSDDDPLLRQGPQVELVGEALGQTESPGGSREAAPIEMHIIAQRAAERQEEAHRAAAASSHGGREAAPGPSVSKNGDPTGPVDVDARYAGHYDVRALALAKAGYDVPWLSAEQNQQLRAHLGVLADQRIAVEHLNPARNATAAAVQRLIPHRERVLANPYLELTVAQRELLAQAAQSLVQSADLADRMGMDPDRFAATVDAARQLLVARQRAADPNGTENGTENESAESAPAPDAAWLSNLSDPELVEFVGYATGQIQLPEILVEGLARRLREAAPATGGPVAGAPAPARVTPEQIAALSDGLVELNALAEGLDLPAGEGPGYLDLLARHAGLDPAAPALPGSDPVTRDVARLMLVRLHGEDSAPGDPSRPASASRSTPGSGGAPAGEPAPGEPSAALDDVVTQLLLQTGPKGRRVLAYSARGPPTVLVDTETAGALWAERGLGDLPDELPGLFWRHPRLAPDGVIVVFDRALAGLAAAADHGGPIADGVDAGAARNELLPKMRRVVAGARPLSADEFPNLARGPPSLLEKVRITDERLLDGKLVGFGWKPAGGTRDDGVIVVPARVARLVDRLIELDPAFGGWWGDFLLHEWNFHINGDEHTGAAHDADANKLLAQLKAKAKAALGRETIGLGRFRLSGEHRYYPTWLQEMIERNPELGPLLFEFLHLKLRRGTAGEKSTAVAKKGLGAKWRQFRDRVNLIRARIAAMVYNRAFIVGQRVGTQVTVVEIPLPHGGVYRLVISAQDLGQAINLDQQRLGGQVVLRSRTLGAFLVIRFANHFAVPGLGRIDLSLVHFIVPGKQVVRVVAPPKLTGRERWNPVKRFANWVKVQNWSVLAWKPFEFIAQTQLVVGVGPFGAEHSNYSEYRFSIQGLEIQRAGKPVRRIDFIRGPARQLGRGAAALGRLVRAGAVRLPSWMRRPARAVWNRVWPRSLAERRHSHTARVVVRGLNQLKTVVNRQKAERDAVATELGRVMYRISVARGGPDPHATGSRSWLTRLRLSVRGAWLRLRHRALTRAIDHNEKAIGEARKALSQARQALTEARTKRIGGGGQGGPVADGVPGDVARAELEPVMPAVAAGARPLRA